MPMKHSACRSCHRPIFWAVTIHDRSMPMDPDHYDDGDWVIDGEAENGAPKIRHVEPLTDGDATRYQPHWATCPNADQHRKRDSERRKKRNGDSR